MTKNPPKLLHPDPVLAELAAIRRERGISQPRMAERLRVAPKTIAFWEQGRRVPPIDRIRDYAESLGYDLDLVSKETTCAA